MPYEIGYRRPPPSGQFKKGQSGNAKGRPKGSKNFFTLLDKELEQTIVVNENGKKKTITRKQAIVKKMVSGALQSDLKTLMALMAILRSTDKSDVDAPDLQLPEDYEQLLDAYVKQSK